MPPNHSAPNQHVPGTKRPQTLVKAPSGQNALDGGPKHPQDKMLIGVRTFTP